MSCDEAVVLQALHSPPERAPAQFVPAVPHELPQLRLRDVLAVHDLAQQRQILSLAQRDCSFGIPHAGLTSPRAIAPPSMADLAAAPRRTFPACHAPIQTAALQSGFPVARCLR